MVTVLGLLDEVAVQPIVLPGVHRGRLPTVLSRGGPRAFNLQIRTGTDAVRWSDHAMAACIITRNLPEVRPGRVASQD